MRYRMIAVCLLVACSTTMADESAKLKDIQKKITERAKKHNSVQYKMKMSMDMSQAGMSIKSETTSTIKYMKKDDKVLSRMESTTNMEMKGNGMDQKSETKSTSVVDGEYTWSYSETQGMKNASKSKVDKNKDPFDPSAIWDEFDVTLKDDETIDGKKCWALEMTPKNPMLKQQMSKSVTYYDQESALMVKQIGYDPQGKVMTTMTVSDVKLNESIDPKTFTFTPPPGVEVQDMTNAKGGMPGMGG
ncbi:MAG: outer membrane lipoprotein carrier protein LolA [Phycisphaerales bacterium]|nr:outer membrane lipoprotein carrier protein LolA [Phycisphaerales bacterium]